MFYKWSDDHLFFFNKGIKSKFFCLFVYVCNFVVDRKVVWEAMRNHQDSPMFRDKPWLIFGDFNEILKGAEHSL